MATIRHWRATDHPLIGAALSLCAAAIAGIAVLIVLGSTQAKGQAIMSAPLVVHEAIRPVVLANGFAGVRDRARAERAVADDRDDVLAPSVIRARWQVTLDGRVAGLRQAMAREAQDAIIDWDAAVERVRLAADPIREAQRLVHHRIRYRLDRPGHDHWQTPLQTLARGAGDCEDHAILKRALLLDAGVDPETVSLLFVRTARGFGHVLVQVETEDGVRILDNRTRAQRIGRLLPGDQVLAVHRTRDRQVVTGL